MSEKCCGTCLFLVDIDPENWGFCIWNESQPLISDAHNWSGPIKTIDGVTCPCHKPKDTPDA